MEAGKPFTLASANLSDLAVQDALVWGDAAPGPAGLQGPHFLRDFAQSLYAFEAFEPVGAGRRVSEEAEPYSLQWFLNIESRRHSKQGRWIPKLLEFTKHAGETLLGLGHGLGTDWAQYARHGAQVVVCSPSASQLELVRRNFDVRGLGGRFIHANPGRLPLESASVDVAMVSSLMHGIDDLPGVVAEVFRVLRPGGKVLAVTSARYDVDFWFNSLFFWVRGLGVQLKRSVPRRLQFSGRELRRLFHPFIETRVHKRQLRRSEVPHIWRWIPVPLLARWMGRVLVFKGFKPVRAGGN